MLLVSKVILLLEVFLFCTSSAFSFTVGYERGTKSSSSLLRNYPYLHPYTKSRHCASDCFHFERKTTLKPHCSTSSTDCVGMAYAKDEKEDKTQIESGQHLHWLECIKNIFADRQVLEVSIHFTIIKVLTMKILTRIFSRD